MPSINDILNGLGVDDSVQEKTAGQIDSQTQTDIEAEAARLGLIDGNELNTTKTASNNNGGTKMDLNDLYNQHFGEEATKIASAPQTKKEDVLTKEASLELAGEQAGEIFAQELDNRLTDYAIKIAMDTQPDSTATKANQSGSGVIGASADPALPVNRPADADKGMQVATKNTSPYDLSKMDPAKAKASLEALIENGTMNGSMTAQTQSGMETPTSQKTASLKIQDLSREELLILNANIDEDLMKVARAEVAEEMSKVAELQDMAADCYNYGAELAMQKIAEMEENAKEEAKEDESAEGEKKEEKEEEKTASAMGKFILEGYWNTMMEKGAEYHKDQGIYIEELIKEAGKVSLIERLQKK